MNCGIVAGVWPGSVEDCMGACLDCFHTGGNHSGRLRDWGSSGSSWVYAEGINSNAIVSTIAPDKVSCEHTSKPRASHCQSLQGSYSSRTASARSSYPADISTLGRRPLAAHRIQAQPSELSASPARLRDHCSRIVHFAFHIFAEFDPLSPSYLLPLSQIELFAGIEVVVPAAGVRLVIIDGGLSGANQFEAVAGDDQRRVLIDPDAENLRMRVADIDQFVVALCRSKVRVD